MPVNNDLGGQASEYADEFKQNAINIVKQQVKTTGQATLTQIGLQKVLTPEEQAEKDRKDKEIEEKIKKELHEIAQNLERPPHKQEEPQGPEVKHEEKNASFNEQVSLPGSGPSNPFSNVAVERAEKKVELGRGDKG